MFNKITYKYIYIYIYMYTYIYRTKMNILIILYTNTFETRRYKLEAGVWGGYYNGVHPCRYSMQGSLPSMRQFHTLAEYSVTNQRDGLEDVDRVVHTVSVGGCGCV